MNIKFIKSSPFLIFLIFVATSVFLYHTRTNVNSDVIDYRNTQNQILSSLMQFAGIPKIANDKDIKCLSENIYREASNQTIEGMSAVGHVVLNRMESGKFPSSACAVVKQKVGSSCQFSWNCQKNLRKIDYTSENWQQSYAVAYHLLNDSGKLPDPTGEALFYHANYVHPNWGNRLKKTKIIGDHIFYAPKGNI